VDRQQRSGCDGRTTHHGVLLGVRHDLVPAAAYFLGRGLVLSGPELRRIGATILATARSASRFSARRHLRDPLSWWRGSGAPGWFRYQLGFPVPRPVEAAENFFYNTGNEHPLRRLVSTFFSPLASSYLFVVALLLAAGMADQDGRPQPAVWIPVRPCSRRAPLDDSRSSYLALALGLVASHSFAVSRGCR